MATNLGKNRSVTKLLDNFEERRQQHTLECVPPWQNYELMQRKALTPGSTDTSSFDFQYSVSAVTSAFSDTSQPFYLDPYLSGIEGFLLYQLITKYWTTVHPIESILDEKDFWAHFEKYSNSASKKDRNNMHSQFG